MYILVIYKKKHILNFKLVKKNFKYEFLSRIQNMYKNNNCWFDIKTWFRNKIKIIIVVQTYIKLAFNSKKNIVQLLRSN